MSHKQAKELRRNLKHMGVDVREKEYSEDKAETITLTDDCGRSTYQHLKRNTP